MSLCVTTSRLEDIITCAAPMLTLSQEVWRPNRSNFAVYQLEYHDPPKQFERLLHWLACLEKSSVGRTGCPMMTRFATWKVVESLHQGFLVLVVGASTVQAFQPPLEVSEDEPQRGAGCFSQADRKVNQRWAGCSILSFGVELTSWVLQAGWPARVEWFCCGWTSLGSLAYLHQNSVECTKW